MSRKRIAVLMASIDREYQQIFASSLASAGEKLGLDICIFNCQGHMNVAAPTSEARESKIYDLPDLQAFDGIISMPATMGSDITLRKLYDVIAQAKGKPHISIDVPQDEAVTIQFDDRVSMEQLTEHLITVHGARRFAFVSGPLDSAVAAARLEACRNVLKRHGLALDDSMIFDGQWIRSGGRMAAEKLLKMGGKLPDAIMCSNDDMALSVIECLKEHGIRAPRDIAITGFDALQEAVMRGLTTIYRPIDKSAQKAIEILNAWIDGEEPREKRVLLSTVPVFGSSCGCTQSLEHINERLRSLVSEKWNMEATLTRISMFSGVMAGVGDEVEAHEKIRDFAAVLGIREFYLCVDPAICREIELSDANAAYPEKMLLLCGVRNEKTYHIKFISTSELALGMQQDRADAVCLVFCPLYYRDRSLGFVAMNLGKGTNTALYPILMLLNGALMSLYMQTNVKRSASTIERMAVHDILTGMLNRRGYMNQAPLTLDQAKREGKVFALLSADMNGMKRINDQYGHLKGDEAICRMGRALRCLGKYGMTPVHISGDEFLAYGILHDAGNAASLAKYVNDELARMNREEPWLCNISAGVGVYAAVPRQEDTIDTFMTMADRAMYEDKNKLKYGRRKDDKRIEKGGE